MDGSQGPRAKDVQDHLDAMALIRSARNVFVWVLLAVLVLQLVLYFSVSRGRLVLTPPGDTPAVTEAPTSAPATAPAETVEVEQAPAYSAACVRALRITLPIARFVGVVCALLLVACYFVGLFVCLAGRLGGAVMATAAVLWSVALVLLLLPWQALITGTDCRIPAAFLTFDELRSIAKADPVGTVPILAHYVRFVGWPLLALLVTVVGSLRFRGAWRAVGQRLVAGKAE